MNKGIELHDSELGAIVKDAGEVVVVLSPAYLHSSEGRPGVDAGSGWLQRATMALGDGLVGSVPVRFPVKIAGGFLRIDGKERTNIVPVGMYAGAVELSMVLATGEALSVRGRGICIELHGEPSFVEDFYP